MNAARSFLDTVYFLFKIGKFVGLSCYGVTKGTLKYKISLNASHFIQFMGFVGIFLSLIYFNFHVEFTTDETSTRIFNEAQQIQMIMSLFFVVGGYSQVLLMRQRFWDLAHTVQEIDIQITQLLKTEIDHNNLYRFTLIRLFVCYSSVLVVYITFGYYYFVINKSQGMMVQYLTYFLINITYTLLTIQFQVFMRAIYLRFSILNAFIESRILSQTHLEMSSAMLVKLQANTISIAKISDQLNSLVPLLSLYYSFFVVPATLGVFFLTVFNFHSLFRAISQENSLQFYLLVAVYQILGLQFNALFGLNVSIASRMTSELKMLSLQVLHRSPNVSFGLFSLNWQLVFSYVASVASYLFILIQFVMYLDEKSVVLMQNQQIFNEFNINVTLSTYTMTLEPETTYL